MLMTVFRGAKVTLIPLLPCKDQAFLLLPAVSLTVDTALLMAVTSHPLLQASKITCECCILISTYLFKDLTLSRYEV